jgi:tricorn protease
MKHIGLFILTFILFSAHQTNAQEARMMRFPAVHGSQIVFSYAGDLYTVARSGGVARKLTNHEGYEMFPRFSHDGKQIAFTAQYDGNTEVYVMPSGGGVPKRLTYSATIDRDDVADRMGPNNVTMAWTPDDKSIIYRGRSSSFNPFKGMLYQVPVTGGLSKELPFSVASWATFNADGSKLAMNRVFREFRTWKYYKGGMADDIWIFDVKSGKSENVTNNPAQDVFPMYYKDKVYFLSDRDRTVNLFEYDVNTKQTRKVTDFNEFDCKFPSLGNDAIAFENGGYIYLYSLSDGKTEKVTVTIAEDYSSGRNKMVDASTLITSYAISPDGNRATFSARGDIFTVPAKSGVTRNLTKSPGAHDRNVEWSPDGQWVSFVSDRTGEDEVYIQKQDGSQPVKQLTKGGGSYKFNPIWSPDGKFILFGDRGQDLVAVNVSNGSRSVIYHSPYAELTDYTIAPDGKWIAYREPGRARAFDVIKLYNMETRQNVAVTDAWYASSNPAFSLDGKYLYMVSQRDFNPIYSSTEWNHAYNDMGKVYVVRLAATTPSLFVPEEDEVKVLSDSAANKVEETKKTPKKPDVKSVQVDAEGILDRIESLPVTPGFYFTLQPVANGLYYFSGSRTQARAVRYFGLKDKKEVEVGEFNGFLVSRNEKKVLLKKGDGWFLEDLPTAKLEPKSKLDLSGLRYVTDVKAEWKQIFDESWRQMRDYFYDPNMHGVNWKAMHDRYAALLPYVNHRNDLTYLIGEMIGELNVGHAYVNGGDRPTVDRVKLGMLGAVLEKDRSGYFKIQSILPGLSWDKSMISPLRAPGVDVAAGEYIVSVDGQDVRDLANIYEALVGKAGQLVELRISKSGKEQDSRRVVVRPISDESKLYYQKWVDDNIAKVSKASDGKIGYLHIPDMGPDGLNQFARYFYPQLDKQALIIDDRGNGGGNVSPMIIERLLRKPALGAMMRNATVPVVKPDVQIGPKVCLIDQYSASDGDLFPYQFKYHGIGALIGQRSWGGVVGIRGTLPFIDGGDLRKPEFAHFAADGSEFIIEGVGVSPDIEVVNDPHQEYLGNDTQLLRGIEELKKKLVEPGSKGVPAIPPFPDKSKG